MLPYEKASKTLQEKSQQPVKLLKTAGSLALSGGSLLGGSAMLSRVMGLLKGNLTPQALISGLSKINPKFGKFINDGLKAGESLDQIKDFIGEKVQTAEQTTPKSLFHRLVGNLDFNQLDEKTTKELSFLSKIAEQLEAKGKDEKDPQVKKLKKKIDKTLQGLSGLSGEAMAMAPENEMMQPQMQGQPMQQGDGQQALMQSLQQAIDFLGRRRG